MSSSEVLIIVSGLIGFGAFVCCLGVDSWWPLLIAVLVIGKLTAIVKALGD